MGTQGIRGRLVERHAGEAPQKTRPTTGRGMAKQQRDGEEVEARQKAVIEKKPIRQRSDKRNATTGYRQVSRSAEPS